MSKLVRVSTASFNIALCVGALIKYAAGHASSSSTIQLGALSERNVNKTMTWHCHGHLMRAFDNPTADSSHAYLGFPIIVPQSPHILLPIPTLLPYQCQSLDSICATVTVPRTSPAIDWRSPAEAHLRKQMRTTPKVYCASAIMYLCIQMSLAWHRSQSGPAATNQKVGVAYRDVTFGRFETPEKLAEQLHGKQKRPQRACICIQSTLLQPENAAENRKRNKL